MFALISDIVQAYFAIGFRTCRWRSCRAGVSHYISVHSLMHIRFTCHHVDEYESLRALWVIALSSLAVDFRPFSINSPKLSSYRWGYPTTQGSDPIFLVFYLRLNNNEQSIRQSCSADLMEVSYYSWNLILFRAYQLVMLLQMKPHPAHY